MIRVPPQLWRICCDSEWDSEIWKQILCKCQVRQQPEYLEHDERGELTRIKKSFQLYPSTQTVNQTSVSCSGNPGCDWGAEPPSSHSALSRHGPWPRTGAGQGGVPGQEDVQGGAAGRHEDLHQASLPAEEEDQGAAGREAPAESELGQRPVSPGRGGGRDQPGGGPGGGAGHCRQLQADLLARSLIRVKVNYCDTEARAAPPSLLQREAAVSTNLLITLLIIPSGAGPGQWHVSVTHNGLTTEAGTGWHSLLLTFAACSQCEDWWPCAAQFSKYQNDFLDLLGMRPEFLGGVKPWRLSAACASPPSFISRDIRVSRIWRMVGPGWDELRVLMQQPSMMSRWLRFYGSSVAPPLPIRVQGCLCSGHSSQRHRKDIWTISLQIMKGNEV